MSSRSICSISSLKASVVSVSLLSFCLINEFSHERELLKSPATIVLHSISSFLSIHTYFKYFYALSLGAYVLRNMSS